MYCSSVVVDMGSGIAQEGLEASHCTHSGGAWNGLTGAIWGRVAEEKMPGFRMVWPETNGYNQPTFARD